MIDMTIRAVGDYHIDDHHTVEDTGIAFGQAIVQAVGDKGHQSLGYLLPMDDALFGTWIYRHARFGVQLGHATQKIGNFDTELVREFFQALLHAGLTLHIDRLHG